jgi:hypothetical protein
VQCVRPAEGLRDTAHVGALRAWGARNDLDVVALSPLELGEVRDVRLNPTEPGQVEVADVRDFHRLRTLNRTNRLKGGQHINHKVTAAGTLVVNPTPRDHRSEGAPGRDTRGVVRETTRKAGWRPANLAAPDGDTTDIPSPGSRADGGLMGRRAWAAPRRSPRSRRRLSPQLGTRGSVALTSSKWPIRSLITRLS